MSTVLSLHSYFFFVMLSQGHVERNLSFHIYFTSLVQSGAGISGMERGSPGAGSQESHEQGPFSPGSKASPQTAAAPGGQGRSASSPLQRYSYPQYLYVWGHERSVCSVEGPCHGQCSYGDSAWGDGVGSRNGYESFFLNITHKCSQ